MYSYSLSCYPPNIISNIYAGTDVFKCIIVSPNESVNVKYRIYLKASSVNQNIMRTKIMGRGVYLANLSAWESILGSRKREKSTQQSTYDTLYYSK